MLESYYKRLQIPEIQIGIVKIGGANPIALQSMTNTNTNDVDASVAQCIRVFDAGADYVRLTAQGVKEAENLRLIKDTLRKKGYNQPLVADIHFNPQAALVAAKYVEKVRINPGNYVGALRKTEYTDEEYVAELEKVRENILPLLETCKANNTAIRIGVNHGSLSQRIVSRYGDTPEGMVVSMMEFLHICKDADFKKVACSIKASNTRIMVQATRLLAERMVQEDCCYPIHLGVTEAGAGEDGRIKSAVGSGSLLLDGIGDTIRVSLTEAPEAEIPVCKLIVDYRNLVFSTPLQQFQNLFVPKAFQRNISKEIFGIGGNSVPMVISKEKGKGDFILTESSLIRDNQQLPIVSLENYDVNKQCVLKLTEQEISHLEQIAIGENTILLLQCNDIHTTYFVRALVTILKNHSNPILLQKQYSGIDAKTVQIRAAMDFGSVLLDELIDGVCISADCLDDSEATDLSFAILQASRSRFEKTEFISCPSCGRTLFQIEEALKAVKAKTSHLKGLKIAVMGCIVNGPGEMSDADYGYMGSGKGTVNLYKKKTLVQRNIPEATAVDALIALIRENGDWKECE